MCLMDSRYETKMHSRGGYRMKDYQAKVQKQVAAETQANALITKDMQEKYTAQVGELFKNFSELANCFWAIPPSKDK